MSAPGWLGAKAARILDAVRDLKLADCEDIERVTRVHRSDASAYLSKLAEKGYVQRISSRMALTVQSGQRKRIVWQATGKRPLGVYERAPTPAHRQPRPAQKQRAAGSGVIAGKPYHRGALWLGSSGAPW
jgi:hypothetical protein